MDDVRKFILEESEKPGNSLRKWSLAIGRNESYLHQFVHKNSPRKLPEDDRIRLAEVMGASGANLGAPAHPTQNARMGSPVALGAMIPAYGHAVGGSDGQFILNGNRIADVIAPPALTNVPGAYAVYVVGSSMEPRYNAGEAVFVNPRLPVRPNDYVVAQIIGDDENSPDAYVKKYVGRDSKSIRLAQFNPRKTLIFPAKRVVSVHRIIMGGDG